MLNRILRTMAMYTAFALLLVGNSSAVDQIAENGPGQVAEAVHWESPTYALQFLKNEHGKDSNTLIFQKELDFLIDKDGGGACATAAGINLLQTLRIMAGLDQLPNPHKIALEAFLNQEDLLKGRVSNEQFVKLVESFHTHLDGAKLAIEVESASNYPEETRKWSESKGPDLTVAPRQIKVLSYTVTASDGHVLGRHFVLLRESRKNTIVVVDPTNPAKERSYVIEHKLGDGAAYERVFLLQPAGIPSRTSTFELNTVFTVTILQNDGRGESQPGNSNSVDFIKKSIDRTASELRESENFLSPTAWRKKTASFGLPGLDLPTEHGGSDWPASKMLEIFKHAGMHNLNFRDVVGGAHVRPLLHSKEPEVLDIVKQVAKGKAYIAISITEPDVGSEVTAIKSTSRKVDGGYELTGEKKFNARLEQATHVILFTQGSTGEQGKLSVFVLPIDTPGLTIERLSAHGLTGNSFGGLKFKKLFVPESHRIGEDGEGMRIFHDHFLYWRLMQTAAALGTGEDALRQMAERIKSRRAFGGPIGRFTHLQQPLGQHTTELQMAYSLAREAAAMIDRGDYRAARTIICGLKAEGVEIALKATDSSMRAFGAEGYSHLVDLGDRLRDLNGLRIADGTTDVMRMVVVRGTFGNEFWDMAVLGKE